MTFKDKALGTWNNAPLALVLAQIRFTPFEACQPEEYVNAYISAIGAEYPHKTPIQQIQIGLGPNGLNEEPFGGPRILGYDLVNEATTKVVRIEPGVLTFSVTAYSQYSDFDAEWRRLLDLLGTIGEVHASRLGMRYVDFIVPSEGNVPENYVKSPLGVSPLEEESPIVFNLYEPFRQMGRMRIQYGRGFGPPQFPPDLQGLLAPPARLMKKYESGLSAVLDIDRWVEAPLLKSGSEIASTFTEMHDDMSAVFNQIITPFAKGEWTAL